MAQESDKFDVLLTEEEIDARVKELGKQISEDYEGKELVAVGVLRGSFIFAADLARQITIPMSIDFVSFSSYGASTRSSGIVRLTKDLEDSVEGKHVLLIEDIVDTGLTLKLSNIVDTLYAKKAASVRICVLLDRPDRRKVSVNIDYVGFTIPNRYVVGYGLDLAGLYRNMPYIGLLKEEVEEP